MPHLTTTKVDMASLLHFLLKNFASTKKYRNEEQEEKCLVYNWSIKRNGLSTQQHIHDKLIERAKEKLSTTDLSVSEIAYELGFEHQQSFSKLFKNKTNISSLKFRKTFI